MQAERREENCDEYFIENRVGGGYMRFNDKFGTKLQNTSLSSL